MMRPSALGLLPMLFVLSTPGVAAAKRNIRSLDATPRKIADFQTPQQQVSSREQRFTGPALVCGEAFALRLAAGESLIRRDPGIDFILYYAQGADGPFLIYEGNAPQPHDDEIRTGLSFP